MDDVTNQYNDRKTLDNKYRMHIYVMQDQRLNDEEYRDMFLMLLGDLYMDFIV